MVIFIYMIDIQITKWILICYFFVHIRNSMNQGPIGEYISKLGFGISNIQVLKSLLLGIEDNEIFVLVIQPMQRVTFIFLISLKKKLLDQELKRCLKYILVEFKQIRMFWYCIFCIYLLVRYFFQYIQDFYRSYRYYR